MESDDDFQLLPPSPVHERKLKRLKKATRAPQHSHPSALPTNFPESGNAESGPELETLGPSPRPNTPKGVTVEDDGVGAKRVLDFDSVSEEHGKVAEEAEEVGDLKTSEEVENLNTGEGERKRRSLDDLPEKKEKKKKKRVDDGDGSEKKQKESTSNKRKAEKAQTRDAAFKPAPVVQKPISSILNKIRQRKLEILKKSSASFEDNDDFAMDEDVTNKVEKSEPVTCPAATKSDLNTPPIGDSNDAANNLSSESIPSPMFIWICVSLTMRCHCHLNHCIAKDSESEHAFRAPIDEAAHEKSNNPSEVFAPSMLAMNLKLDSAPPDDDVSSDEEEEGNDKENIDPHVHGSVDLTLSPSGDPVRAFVDEEAEEEDDSDNDLQRFQDNEEGEEDDDEIEELKDMIATQYEEKSIDREKRDQLHQQWLEQQDAAGMDNLLQKLNCGSKLKEAPLIEEEEEESRETENESDDEAEEYIARSEDMKITLKKVKQMIPLMFTDKDDKYVSSDDEETKEKLARQRFYYKTEEKAEFFSLAEDESSKEVFSLIKKLNVPDTKRKGKTTSILDMPGIGQNTNISSKSSFIGRASDRFVPPSRKQGSCKIRSYIFGRDDSNSRSSILMSEDSSDTIPRESQPQKAASVKFQRNTQNKNATLNSAPQKSKVSLLEILKRSSHQAEHSIQNATVQPKESIFDAFKLVKKPTKTEARV
uniref:Uncharacterized protein n=1 Tax=Cajanus cajan TaxID=3821 RepID=A0A151TC19_CAJCA|nr:hypothetical protein KK1_019177 [Cajanus cajan]